MSECQYLTTLSARFVRIGSPAGAVAPGGRSASTAERISSSTYKASAFSLLETMLLANNEFRSDDFPVCLSALLVRLDVSMDEGPF